jgi:hypothetical protein
VVVATAEFRQGFAKRVPEERWEELGATEGKGRGVEGAGGLPSKPLGSLVKGGGRKSLLSFPHRLLSPHFRDLDLIPSGYDPIPFKGGSWCA